MSATPLLSTVQQQALLEENEQLREEIKELKRLIFGSKRERFVPQVNTAQLSLELISSSSEPAVVVKQTISYERAVKQIAKKAIRGGFPTHLPRIDVILQPKEDVSGMRKIGEEITEELDLKPASLFVRRYIRPRYVSKEETFHIAVLPARPIEKGMPGAGLLSQIIADKFVSHLPFYRQAQRYEQLGMKIPASSLDGWFEGACALLEPLYQALRLHILASTYLQADETPIAVLDKQKKGDTHQGYHWVYYSPEERLVLFEYQPGRGKDGPAKLLKNYKGYLQTDGYVAYDQFETREDIVLVGCMAHARRYFEHALDNDKARAEKVLLWIQQLYAVEREAREKNLSTADRYLLRQQKARPVMDLLGEWLVAEHSKVLPKSAIGKAIYYLVARYNKIYLYLEDGRLEIDNNPVENAIRPVALGRKNYLFAGSHAGAQRAAIVYSLLGSCKLQGINAHDYLQDVLQRLPNQPINQLKELLPSFWKKINSSPQLQI
ncbi:IS66 family transposase [Rhodocytophaga rosea]|uniref:IS66 family transposase n=1 Tax=Rhodocytophaga rosea TaxID=2704465 RepID=A0A6C0GM73_9BACT|nr:IS66 family transposase [Rhodocytophaga rosea]QHT67374.1 IS66 family transposase [Rhodocytophaga rosea]QHT68712.1 IS66 family transposase [Rhodocytophaga rosea]QHT70853.1 IS66 family transposase [Rhodocytophaga rosea]